MHDIGSADLTPMEQVSYFFSSHSPLLINRISPLSYTITSKINTYIHIYRMNYKYIFEI